MSEHLASPKDAAAWSTGINNWYSFSGHPSAAGLLPQYSQGPPSTPPPLIRRLEGKMKK